MAKQQDQDHQYNLITSGSNVRLEEVKSSRSNSRHTRPKIILNVAQTSPIGGFVGFLREYAVVGLIIGFVLGNQVQSLVKQLVQSFLDPLTHLLFGTELSQRTFTLHFHGRYANFGWGGMVYTLVIFVLVLFSLYATIRILKLDKLKKTDKK